MHARRAIRSAHATQEIARAIQQTALAIRRATHARATGTRVRHATATPAVQRAITIAAPRAMQTRARIVMKDARLIARLIARRISVSANRIGAPRATRIMGAGPAT